MFWIILENVHGSAGARQTDLHLESLPGRLDTHNRAVKFALVHGLDSSQSQSLDYLNNSTLTKSGKSLNPFQRIRYL